MARRKRVETDGKVQVFGRNANGEGSVYFDASTSRWVATWWTPGAKRPNKATGKTRQAAIDRRGERQAKTAPASGDLVTVAQLCDWWLNTIYKHSVSIDTWHKAKERLPRIKRMLGHHLIDAVDYGVVAQWQARMLADGLRPDTVRNYRASLALMFDEAVKLRLIQGNPVRAVAPPPRQEADKPTVQAERFAVLLKAAQGDRLGAAVAVLFLQGWRVSETLGLAWPDVDFDTGRVQLARISVYRPGQGMVLKPRAKTEGAHGEHWLAPTVLELLDERRQIQALERELAGDRWQQPTMGNTPVDLVFTNQTGGLVLRHHVERAVARAARKAGIDPAGLATHGGRRSLITALWAEGGESLEDIARHVGHASENTTKGYVQRLGRRPRAVADRAAALLDPAAKSRQPGDNR
jgi:integrase